MVNFLLSETAVRKSLAPGYAGDACQLHGQGHGEGHYKGPPQWLRRKMSWNAHLATTTLWVIFTVAYEST